MSKPTIFFSHSSRDEKTLSRLKTKFQDYTGGTIDVFLSSDGQSIPFGRNWVHSIEKALERSKIMMVFISPNSMQSHWVYFESGYSYSKGIEVIPIGIDGMDLNQIPSPLNLLQGFNLNSSDGLNNIINIINNKFDFSHKESFTDKDYMDIFKCEEEKQSDLFGEFISYIDHIEFILYNKLTNDGKSVELNPSCMDEIHDYFVKNNIEFGKKDNVFFLNGCKIQKKTINKTETQINITIDTVIARRNIELVHNLMAVIYNNYSGNYFLKIFFSKNSSIITDDYKISSRLHGTGVKISQKVGTLLEYENIMFSIDAAELNIRGEEVSPPSLRIVYNIKELNEIPLKILLDILRENGIIS